MSQFYKFGTRNEPKCLENDKITIIIDDIKLAREQCDELKEQLEKLWKLLSSDPQVISIFTPHTTDASGEGGQVLQHQISNYQSARCVYPAESKQDCNIGDYNELDRKSLRDDGKRVRKKLKGCSDESDEIKKANQVVTLFKKQDTNSSITNYSCSAKRMVKRPTEVKPRIDAGNNRRNIAASNTKQVTKEHALPFVVGTSTSQSHNICLNFQEVIAKLKRRHPKLIEADEENNESRTAIAGNGDNFDDDKGDKVEEIYGKQATMLLSDELRTQKFKEVLKNLYKEFTAMSQDYESLMAAYTSDNYNKTLLKKQLKKLDNILSKKEDEIVILISMYRQVMTMKEEVSRSSEKERPPKNQQLSNITNLRLKVLLTQMRKLQLNLKP